MTKDPERITVKKIKPTEDGLFGIPPLDPENPYWRKTSPEDPIWKTRKYYICQTGGMPLWVALNQMSVACLYRECNDHRNHYKAAVLSFPGTISDCRCKDCRYFRLAKKQILAYTIHMSCKTPDLCKLDDFPYSLCDDCMVAIEELALQNAADMGVPDHFYCGICGRKMTPKDYARHAALYPKGENLDLEDTKTFTPQQEKMIDQFMDDNRELMEELQKLEAIEDSQKKVDNKS